MAKIRHHLLDRILQSVEVPECRVNLDHLVAEQAGQTLIMPRVEQFRLANGGKNSLSGGRVDERVALAGFKVFLDGKFLLPLKKIGKGVEKFSAPRKRSDGMTEKVCRL